MEAPDVAGVLDVLGVEPAGDRGDAQPSTVPEPLRPVAVTLADVYEGVRAATEQDSRGRSRKLVRRYADREDLSSEAVGHLLRVLESHDLVVQDGNRWRLADG